MTDTPPPTDPIEPPPTEPASSPQADPQPAELEGDDRNLLLLAHGLGIILWVIPAVIIWLMKKDERPALGGPLKETINFQITWGVVLCLLSLTLFIPLLNCITILVWLVIWVAMVIFLILAAIDAGHGKAYKFPLKLNLLK